jgi:hypothetical protein
LLCKNEIFLCKREFKISKTENFIEKKKCLHACMKSSILLLEIYTENKPSAKYARRLVEKYKIAIKNIKIMFVISLLTECARGAPEN